MVATAAVASPGQQRVLLRGISWATYEGLLNDQEERSSPRFAYDRGMLEIVPISLEHEEPNRSLATVVEIVAEELGIDFRNVGSTTFKRKDLAQGFESDTAFYIRNEPRVRGLATIDLASDPPPDLVIEIDVTSSSLNRCSIYGGMGVPEVWRYEGRRVTIWKFTAGGYTEAAASEALPFLTAELLTRFLAESRLLRRPEWMRSIRTWVRQQVEAMSKP
jgi:Uma2 family endonuclease